MSTAYPLSPLHPWNCRCRIVPEFLERSMSETMALVHKRRNLIRAAWKYRGESRRAPTALRRDVCRMVYKGMRRALKKIPIIHHPENQEIAC